MKQDSDWSVKIFFDNFTFSIEPQSPFSFDDTTLLKTLTKLISPGKLTKSNGLNSILIQVFWETIIKTIIFYIQEIRNTHF